MCYNYESLAPLSEYVIVRISNPIFIETQSPSVLIIYAALCRVAKHNFTRQICFDLHSWIQEIWGVEYLVRGIQEKFPHSNVGGWIFPVGISMEWGWNDIRSHRDARKYRRPSLRYSVTAPGSPSVFKAMVDLPWWRTSSALWIDTVDRLVFPGQPKSTQRFGSRRSLPSSRATSQRLLDFTPPISKK